MRKVLTVAFIALTIALGAGVAPTTASAAHPCSANEPCHDINHGQDRSVKNNPNYRGWGRVEANYCPPNAACLAVYYPTAEAYRWNGYRWIQTSRRDNAQVYIWPYGAGWSWTWTQQTGWLAMRHTALEY
jgi:hypothetical protein